MRYTSLYALYVPKLPINLVQLLSYVNVVMYSVIYNCIFTARRYASALLAVIVCPSVRPSVCLSVCLSVRLSQVGVVQRWLNLGSD